MKTILASLPLLVSLIVSDTAAACQCGTKSDATAAMVQADLVVAGVVSHLETTELENENGQMFLLQKATFAVRRWWKGPKETSISLSQESNCALVLSEGNAYLLFLDRRDDARGFEATFCSPSKPWRDARSDLELIGPGELLDQDRSNPPNPPLQPTGSAGG